MVLVRGLKVLVRNEIIKVYKLWEEAGILPFNQRKWDFLFFVQFCSDKAQKTLVLTLIPSPHIE